ncbi:MAG: hypothetical protein KKD18_05980 [Nanoarchaeota archaeon]|nr:hypothetical protein [Nanoarchaeota archaeon]
MTAARPSRRTIHIYAEGGVIKSTVVDLGYLPRSPRGEKGSIRHGSQLKSAFGKHGGSRFGVDVARDIDSGYEPVWGEDPEGNQKPLPESVKRSIGVDLTEVILGAAV